MPRSRNAFRIALAFVLFAIVLATANGPAAAEDDWPAAPPITQGEATIIYSPTAAETAVVETEIIETDDDNSAGMLIVLDLVLVRPLGLVATVLGSAFFVAGLPFEAISGDFHGPAHFLVVEPFRFTFERPLGRDMT
jgi:hypothetical protein